MRYFLDPENFGYEPSLTGCPRRFELTRHIPADQFIGVVEMCKNVWGARRVRLTKLLYHRDGQRQEFTTDRRLTPAKLADEIAADLDIKLTKVDVSDDWEYRYARLNLDALIAVCDQPGIKGDPHDRQLLYFEGDRVFNGMVHIVSIGTEIRPPNSVTIPCVYGSLHVRSDRIEWVRETSSELSLRVAGQTLSIDLLGGLSALMGILSYQSVGLLPPDSEE